jgi:hypothetical protein
MLAFFIYLYKQHVAQALFGTSPQSADHHENHQCFSLFKRRVRALVGSSSHSSMPTSASA